MLPAGTRESIFAFSLDRPHFCERLGGVATATVQAEFAIVNIICAVTVTAALTDSCLHIEGLSVTALARDIGVRAVEHEISLPVVIKTPLHPVNRVMARRAVIAEAPVV